MFSDIISEVKTVEDQKTLLQEIDILLDSMFRLGDNAFEPTLTKEVRRQTATRVRQLIDSQGGDKESLLKSLRKEIESLKEIELEIAFDPSEDSIQQIYDWIAKHISQGFVLSFSVNSQIIAGASISYKGKFHNGSLKDKIVNTIH